MYIYMQRQILICRLNAIQKKISVLQKESHLVFIEFIITIKIIKKLLMEGRNFVIVCIWEEEENYTLNFIRLKTR